MKLQQRSSGFTLIELVVVIIILAIIAVVAIAKFIDFRRDGEVARVRATAAAYQQSLTFAHTKWQVLGTTEAMNNMPDFAGGKLDMNRFGYPLGIDKNSPMGAPKNIGRGNKACVSLWDTLLTDPPSVSLSDDGSDFQAYRHSATVEPDGLTQCSYVLRTLGDTSDRQSAKISIIYDSVAGTAVTVIR